MMFMGIGFFTVSLIMYFGYKIIDKTSSETLFNPILIFSGIGGVLWMLGGVLFLSAIDKIGLSRSNQWKNLQGPVGAILTLTFLSEMLSTNIMYIALAILAIFISAYLFTIKNKEEKVIDKKGIIYAAISAIFFGVNALIQKNATNNGLVYAQQVYFSLFAFLSSAIYLIIKNKNLKEITNIKDKNNLLALLGGIIYYFASYFSVLAYKFIPASIAFTIVQLNAVWTIIVGILVFKEIDFKKNWIRILLGICFAIIGVVMLLFAQK